jgi:hypothetical protein
MPMQKRIAVWFLETQCEALLLSVVLIVLSIPNGPSQYGFVHDLLFGLTAIYTVFFTTGYLLTTAIVGIFWRSQRSWLYPSVASVLFLIHFEIFSVGIGGAFEPSERLPIRGAGAGIVFACTFVGGWFLRKWIQVNRK